MRADKLSGSIRGGGIIMVEDYSNIKRNILTKYGLFTQTNIDNSFAAY